LPRFSICECFDAVLHHSLFYGGPLFNGRCAGIQMTKLVIEIVPTPLGRSKPRAIPSTRRWTGSLMLSAPQLACSPLQSWPGGADASGAIRRAGGFGRSMVAACRRGSTRPPMTAKTCPFRDGSPPRDRQRSSLPAAHPRARRVNDRRTAQKQARKRPEKTSTTLRRPRHQG
jgi:hypothetical protein